MSEFLDLNVPAGTLCSKISAFVALECGKQSLIITIGDEFTAKVSPLGLCRTKYIVNDGQENSRSLPIFIQRTRFNSVHNVWRRCDMTTS